MIHRATIINPGPAQKPASQERDGTKDITHILLDHYQYVKDDNARDRMIAARAAYLSAVTGHNTTVHGKVAIRAYYIKQPDDNVWVLVDSIDRTAQTVTGHIDDAIIENDFNMQPGDRVRFHVKNIIKVMLAED